MENNKTNNEGWKIIAEDFGGYRIGINENERICATYRDFSKEENKYHAEFIVSAYNSCKAINQENPIAAANAYVDVLEALNKIHGLCADAANVENGKLDISKIARLSKTAIEKATKQ